MSDDVPDDDWIRFVCPHCGQRNKTPPALAGAPVACSQCGGRMLVPPPPGHEPSLSALVIERADTLRRRNRWPLWLILAHLALPVGTLVALYLLKQNGYLPGLDPPKSIEVQTSVPSE